MKNRNCLTLIFTMLFVLSSLNANAQTESGFGQALKKSGLAKMQNGIGDQVKELMSQKDSEQIASKKTGSKNYAVFKPSPSENMKIIAAELGKNAEEKALYEQLFTETKKGFEAEVASKGMKNNIAAAMTFLMATTVMVYNEAPEPSDEATDKIFNSLNTMIDETPGMASVPNKDKQFLYDAYISFGGLTLAFYSEAKDTKDKDLMNVARVMAGSLLLEFFKINPNKIRFEGNSLVVDPDQPTQTTQTPQNKTPQPPTNNYGITKYTTNFDDGWVATPLADYVRVTKNDVEVRLYYADAQIDRRKSEHSGSHEAYYWDVFVKPSFNAKQIFNRQKEQYAYGQNDNWEATATDKQTGKSRYIGMGLVFTNGSCRTIVVNAPDKNTYYSLFPDDPSFGKMLVYNKFGVAQQDIIGKWSSFSAESMPYYSFYSGDYILSVTASSNDSFVFNSNGTYQSEHSGTISSGGSLAHGKSTYKGTFRVTNDWNLSVTNREANDPGEESCQFEAVKGGFILHLVNKKFTGMAMKLFKSK